MTSEKEGTPHLLATSGTKKTPRVKLPDGGPSSGAPCLQSRPILCLNNQRLLRTEPNRKEENFSICG